MVKSIHGTVAGNSIQCEQSLGLADGTQVEILVRPVTDSVACRERLALLFGSCSEDAESLDEFLKENAIQRLRRRSEPTQ